MMQFPKAGGTPKMPTKKKKGGIGGAIGAMLEKGRAAGRPKMEGMVPGAPKRDVREAAEEAMSDDIASQQRGREFHKGYNPKTRKVEPLARKFKVRRFGRQA